jgi:hypothetical protein
LARITYSTQVSSWSPGTDGKKDDTAQRHKSTMFSGMNLEERHGLEDGNDPNEEDDKSGPSEECIHEKRSGLCFFIDEGALRLCPAKGQLIKAF